MKKYIPIAYSSDDNYAQHMGVSIISLFENKNKDTNLKIYIIDGGISKENIKNLNIIANKYKTFFTYLSINKNELLNLNKKNHLTIAAYFRLFLPNILDENKFIYIDCDTVILNDLDNLFKIYLEDYAIGAVMHDKSNFNDNKLNTNFYNSGVLIFNKKNWIKNNLTQKTLNFAKQNKNTIFADQDCINNTCLKNVKEINKKYNTIVTIFYPFIKKLNLFIKFKKNKIVIIHYVTKIKPWHYLYNGPFKKEYNKYLLMSPWKDYKYPDVSFINFIKKIYFYLAPNYLTRFLVKIRLLIFRK